MPEFTDADLDHDAPRFWWGPSKRARWREATDRRGRERCVEAARYHAEDWVGENGASASVLVSDGDRGDAGPPAPASGAPQENAHDSSGPSADAGASSGGPSDGGSSNSSGGSSPDGGSSSSSDGGSGGE